jgi:hypothetical protein
MTDSKKLKQAEWLSKHTLTNEQFKQLIANKLARAETSHLAHQKREVLLKSH